MRIRWRNTIMIALLTLSLSSTLAHAGSTSTLGISLGDTIDLIGAPCSVEAGELEHDGRIRVFPERLSYVLPTDVTVDNPTGTVIKKGELVDIYYVHADRLGDDKDSSRRFSSSLTFQNSVLGVIASTDKLASTHDTLGAPTTDYSEKSAQGLENGDDSVTLDAATNSLTLDFRVWNVVDQVRVITVATR
jgi:hypothetical protein